MLAGRLPFDKHEDIYALSKTIVEGKFPPPTRFREEVPNELVKIVMKAITKDPKRRY
jgi:serine/threonine protein kinase